MQCKIKVIKSFILCFDSEAATLVIFLGNSSVVLQIVSLRVSIIEGILIVSIQQRIIVDTCLDSFVAIQEAVFEDVANRFV
jgi:hypothetical protein